MKQQNLIYVKFANPVGHTNLTSVDAEKGYKITLINSMLVRVEQPRMIPPVVYTSLMNTAYFLPEVDMLDQAPTVNMPEKKEKPAKQTKKMGSKKKITAKAKTTVVSDDDGPDEAA